MSPGDVVVLRAGGGWGKPSCGCGPAQASGEHSRAEVTRVTDGGNRIYVASEWWRALPPARVADNVIYEPENRRSCCRIYVELAETWDKRRRLHDARRDIEKVLACNDDAAILHLAECLGVFRRDRTATIETPEDEQKLAQFLADCRRKHDAAAAAGGGQ